MVEVVTPHSIRRKAKQRNQPGYDAQGNWLSGVALVESARCYMRDVLECGDHILLAFSGGKDSLAMWLWLREVAPDLRIVPFFMDMIPGLQIVQDMLRYYEDYFGQHIYYMIHPVFYEDLNTYVFQTPENIRLIMALDLPRFDRQVVADLVAEAANVPGKPLHAMGLRRRDNPVRSGLMTVAGVIGTKRSRHFYPIWDWTTDDVARVIKRHNVKLPVGYALWGRNLVNLEYAVLKQVREYFPQDFELIKTYYPLIEAEFFRYEQVK